MHSIFSRCFNDVQSTHLNSTIHIFSIHHCVTKIVCFSPQSILEHFHHPFIHYSPSPILPASQSQLIINLTSISMICLFRLFYIKGIHTMVLYLCTSFVWGCVFIFLGYIQEWNYGAIWKLHI